MRENNLKYDTMSFSMDVAPHIRKNIITLVEIIRTQTTWSTYTTYLAILKIKKLQTFKVYFY